MDPSETPPPDRRRGSRQPVLLSGKVVAAGGLTFDCAIRDLGQRGARISVPTHQPIAPELYLIEVAAGRAHLSQVIWNNPPFVGLSFRESWNLASPACPDALGHVRQIWLETARPRVAAPAGTGAERRRVGQRTARQAPAA